MYEEIIKNRIEQLSPEYRKFVLGDFIEATTRTYSEAFNLDEEQAIIFENGLMLYLLMIINQQKLVEFMHQECDFTLESAQKIVSDIIANLPPSLVYAIHQSYEELSSATTEPTEESPDSLASSQPIPSGAPMSTTTSESLNQAWQPVGQAVPSNNPVLATPPTPPQPVNPAPIKSVIPPVVPPAAPVFSTPQPITPPTPPAAPQTSRPSISDIESRMPPLPADASPTPQWGSAPTPPITPPPATDVQPVRTMEQDVERIHGYSAYRQQYPHLYTDENTAKETVRSLAQDALLQRTPVVDTPRFDESRG